MASLDEYNPGRWEEEDEDFLDREDNYVLQKSTSQVVTNVTAKTRRSRTLNQHVNGKHSTKMTKQPSHKREPKREPPSFASAKAGLRKTPSRRSSSTDRSNHKRSSSSSKLKSANSRQHASAPIRTAASSTSTAVPAPVADSYHQKSLPAAPAPPPSTTARQAVMVSDDASVESEESLDIKQVFPLLQEKPKPPSPSDPHWKSQQIYLPVKQEKWNEASVMRMHQSMMAIPTRRQSYESPYMKELEFDDDDKSLDITDVFPVLAEPGAKKKAPGNKPSSASGPAILQAAKQANANKRWRTAGQKIAATRKGPTAAAKQEPPPAKLEPKAPPPPPPAAAPIPHSKHPPKDAPAAVARQAPMVQDTGHESHSSNEGKKGYQLPTYVNRPSAAEMEGMHASDELTMDSALMKDQHVKEQEEEKKRTHEKETVQQREEEEQERAAAAKLERKLSKRSKKDSNKSHKKKKKKSSRRQLREEDLNSVSSHTEIRRRERDTSLGPESLMEQEEAEAARRRLKKEKKEKKKHKKHKKKHKREFQSTRVLPSQTTAREGEEPVRLGRSMPEIKESQSSSPSASNSPPTSMAASQPAIASKPALDSYLQESEGTRKSRGRSKRTVQSTPSMSSRQSDSKMTTKSDGDMVRVKSLRGRTASAYIAEQDDDDGVLDSYIQGDKKKSASSSKMSIRSQSQTSHTTVKKSNVVKKKSPPPSYSQSAAEIGSHQPESPKMDADVFMRSAAAGLLYEDEDSLSSGAAAAERRRVRTARAESRRSTGLGGNSALNPTGPRKEPLDKNKQQGVASKTSVPTSSSTRLSVLDNDQMNSVGNFDMVSAVDAAVAAKKAEKQVQGKDTVGKPGKEKNGKAKLPPSTKKRGFLKRMFSVRDKSPKKPKKPKGSKKKPTAKSRSAAPQSADQQELNEYLSSSKSSWYENSAQEKKEVYSAPSSPDNVDLHGSLKFALGPPPMEAHRSSRLGTSLPHESSARRGR